MASSGSESEYEVETILESRRRGRATEYKVRWKNFGEDEDSWETERSLMQTAPLVVEQFKKKGSIQKVKSTRLRQVARKDDDEQEEEEDAVSSSRTTRSSTSTTTTTRSTVTKLDSFSDGSDTETPRVVSRVTRTTVTRQTTSGDNAKPKRRSLLASMCPSTSCCSCASIKQNMPFVIYAVCMLVIAASFAYEKL